LASEPRFSIVVPTYNYAHYLDVALRSALEQGRADLEVIVIDDGSTDATSDVVAQYDEVRYVRLPKNRGPGGAWAEGLRVAQGDYVAKLDADDWLLPTWFEAIDEGFEDDRVGAVIGSSVVWLEDAEASFVEKVTSEASTITPEDFRRRLLLEFFFRMPSVCLRRSILDGHDPPRFDLRLPHDWEYLLRVTRSWAARLLPDPIGVYRLHGASLTRTAERAERLSNDFRVFAAAACDPSDPAFLEPKERRLLAAGIARSYLSSAIPQSGSKDLANRVRRARELAAPLGGVRPTHLVEQVGRVLRRRLSRRAALRTGGLRLDELVP